MKKFLIITALLAILAGAAFAAREPIYQAVRYAENRYLPCRQPITYSLGGFDSRFGISKVDFLSVVNQAVKIWEAPVNKKLFAYDADGKNGDLTINLVYDYRQEATQKLKSLGIAITEGKTGYDTLKAKYDSLQDSYNRQKSELVSSAETYKTELEAHNAEVAYWNSRGGAPKGEYDKLQLEKENLDAKAEELNLKQDALNQIADGINALATTLNRMVGELNLSVEKYNTIGVKQSGEFEEGQYVGNASGGKIDVYQFDNRDKLVRVLAHELGHALGLEHLDNPKAIMYRLNQATNKTLTADDIAALKKRCGI